MNRSALILGASRGLGLGLVAEFLARGWAVTATERTRSAELHATNAEVETADVSNHTSIDALAHRVGVQRFDLLFIVAGQWGPRHQSALRASAEESSALFLANAVGPVAAAERLAGAVAPCGTVAFMTSGLASITGNTSGGSTLYRGSKAALNMMAKSFALSDAAKGLTVLLIDPGWVQTDMGGPGAPLTIAKSVRGIADVIAREAGSGRFAFLTHAGHAQRW